MKAVKKNLSIGKALQIIEIMAAHNGPMRLQDIAKGVSQPPSTTLRFLSTLMDYGYAGQDALSLQYFLTMKFSFLGDQVSRQMKVRDVSRPFLSGLSRKSGESVSIAIEQDFNLVHIDVFDGEGCTLQTLQRIGKIAPLHMTAAGKCLLLDFDEAGIDELIKVKGLSAATKNTIHTKKDLLSELKKVRTQGFAEDNEEWEIGVRCVAAPIRDYRGKILAAVSISGPSLRMTGQKIDLIRVEIMKTAEEISSQLGWNPA